MNSVVTFMEGIGLDAIILAAGKGTRLQPHTLTTPKPMLLVQGRPILDWIIAALPPVDRLVVVVNYLAEQIVDYLQTQKHVANWTTVRQEVPRGTGDALLCCRGQCQSDKLLVLNADDLIGKADIARLAQVEAGILVHSVDDPSAFGVVLQKPNGSLDRIIEKPKDVPPPALANIGGYLFPKAVFDLELPLSPRGEYEITDAVSMLAARTPFQVVEAKFWLPIGTVPAWEAAQTQDISPVK